MSDLSHQAVFLSYASQDAEAAKKICDALRAAGVEVWFDQSELRGGDSWDQKIRRQIKECALFMPVVSQNTQARREGYFRLEWKLADDRTHLMAKGTPFLVPVCIDDTKDWDALVPDSFMTVQWTRLPGGETTEKFCSRVVHLLEGGSIPPMPTRPPMAMTPPSTVPAAEPRKKENPAWLTALIVVVPVLVGLVLAWRLLPQGGETPAPPQPSAPAVRPPSAVSEFPRDPDLKRAYKLIYSLDGIAEDYALADDIVKPLLAARPNDPEVVTVAAQVSQELISRGFDTTQVRRAQAQRLTERAVQLAPDSPEALGTLARYLLFVNGQLGRAEELARRAIELDPKQARYYRTLYGILSLTKTATETDAFGARMVALFPADPLVCYDIARRYKDTNDLALAEEWFDKTLALASVGFAMTWKGWFLLEVHGDVAGMKAILDRIPERQRANTRVVNAFATHAFITGETTAALQMLNAVADTWLTDFDFTGPKALLVGQLLQREGRDELARVQYESALVEVRRMLAVDPTDVRPRRAELWTLIGLGRRDEARAALHLLMQSLSRPYRWGIRNSWYSSALRACLLLDEREQALVLLKDACAEPTGRLLLRNSFGLDPLMAPFRGDAEINALLAETKETKTSATTAPMSEAAQLAARAQALYEKVGFTRDDLAPAEDLARRATELEPGSARTWGVRAGVQSAWIFRNWDSSEKRRQDTQAFANRALALDPNEPEALLALGHVLRRQGAFDQAVTLLRRAIAANPDHVRLARALGFTLGVSGRDAEARVVLQELARRVPRDPLVRYELATSYASFGPPADLPNAVAGALEQLDAALAIQPFSSALLLKAALLGGWRGDLPAMRAELDRLEKLPLVDRAEDRSVYIAMWAGLIEHRPDRVETAAVLTTRNYFDDSIVMLRPKSWSLALAHRLAGKDNTARADWHAAETVLRQRLKDDAGNEPYQVELAATLAWLDQRDEAAHLVGVVEPVWKENPTLPRVRLMALYYAALGDAPRAARYLQQVIDQTPLTTRKVVPLDPWWDKLRGAPEFEAVLKTPEPKK